MLLERSTVQQKPFLRHCDLPKPSGLQMRIARLFRAGCVFVPCHNNSMLGLSQQFLGDMQALSLQADQTSYNSVSLGLTLSQLRWVVGR
jgi:hypothetical protein